MKTNFSDIKTELTKKLDTLIPVPVVTSFGTVTRVIDGIAFVSGLSQIMYGELVKFDTTNLRSDNFSKRADKVRFETNSISGLALNLGSDEVGVIVLGDYTQIREGDEVFSTGEILSLPVTDAYLGRVVNSLGVAIDGKATIQHKGKLVSMPIEKIAPGISFRQPVTVPLQTGIKAIDAMIPIGRGQRQLIIGDRNTGKTSIAIDTIINLSRQNREKSGKRVISIYVAIGQKQSKVVNTVESLQSSSAMAETIVISATSSDPIAMQYLAPYTATAIAEYFMGQGEDVLIIYDDLTKHAWSYRQISLTFKRPSGREAYPGDIFYLHSRLLERACRMNENEGGGSITALPIIETQAQDISAYVPTNVISITDGQIFLEPDLFFKGIRPAVSVGLSVSRVGGNAQIKAMKQVAGQIRLNLAQYEELSAFAQFGADMDAISRATIERGKRIIEIFKQPQFAPRPVESQILELWFVENGFLDETPLNSCLSTASHFADLISLKHPKLMEAIVKDGISAESTSKLTDLAKAFVKKGNN